MASNLEKARCAEREVQLRKRVYPRRVLDGHMRHADAKREIDLMEEIAADYRAAYEREPLPLFEK